MLGRDHVIPGPSLENWDNVRYWPKRALSLKKGNHKFHQTLCELVVKCSALK